MAASTYVVLFAITWLVVMAYAASAFRMAFRLRGLKKRGRFAEAPDLFHPLDGHKALGWLLSGRYARLDDPVTARWARIARALFLVAAPLMLAMFALGFGVARQLP